MGSVETFDHTADLGLRIRAENLTDLFKTAAEGLMDVIVSNRNVVEPRVRATIQLFAEDTRQLLVIWLSELIYRMETGRQLFSRFDVELDSEARQLRADVYGESIDQERHLLDHEVKAITQHGLFLGHEADDWIAEIILDI